jgi:hypothetical protein
MKRTKLKNRRTRNDWTNEDWRQECVKTAKLIAKHLAGYKCQNPDCTNSAEKGYQMHGSHIRPESKFHRLSVEPLNIMCQCFTHHSIWHEDPQGQDWFRITFPNRLEEINMMDEAFKKSYIKPDYKKIHEELKEKYNNMIN